MKILIRFIGNGNYTTHLIRSKLVWCIKECISFAEVLVNYFSWKPVFLSTRSPLAFRDIYFFLSKIVVHTKVIESCFCVIFGWRNWIYSFPSRERSTDLKQSRRMGVILVMTVFLINVPEEEYNSYYTQSFLQHIITKTWFIIAENYYN